MRTTLFIASSIFIVACAWGEEAGPPDEDPEIPVCGDGTCASTETNSCASDCGTPNPVTCNNNGTCDSGETTSNCANDCSTATQCGNNVCESGEDTTSCPNDCQTQSGIDCNDGVIQFACGVCLGSGTCELGTSEDACLACLGGGGGAGCSGGVPNGTCDAGEDQTNCPFDCM
jgi:hypothetical protein